MTRLACSRAGEVVRAGGAPLPDELTRHVAACDDCRRARTLAAALAADPAPTGGTDGRPSAGLLWWKSRLAREAAVETDALRPVAVAEAVVPAALLAAVGAWLIADAARWAVWLGPLAGDAVSALLPTTLGVALLGAAMLVGVRLATLTLRRPTAGADRT